MLDSLLSYKYILFYIVLSYIVPDKVRTLCQVGTKKILTLPVGMGGWMTSQRFFEDNSVQNEPKLAKFLPI